MVEKAGICTGMEELVGGLSAGWARGLSPKAGAEGEKKKKKTKEEHFVR